MKRSLGPVLFAAALAAAGCSTSHATAAAHFATRQQQAEADAASILRSFAVPPGARQVKTPPLVNGGVFKKPVEVLGDANLADRAAWFTAPGSPASVLSWEKQHIPQEFSPTGHSTLTGQSGTEPVLVDTYSLPHIAGVLDFRQLLVEVTRDGASTAIRVDAQVTWVPAQPASKQPPA